MKIAFSNPEEWLEELEDVAGETEVHCVRASIETVQGSGNQEVVFIGSFMGEDLLFELMCITGRDEHERYQPGTDEANRIKAATQDLCGKLGIKLRGGRIDLGI